MPDLNLVGEYGLWAIGIILEMHPKHRIFSNRLKNFRAT